MAAPRPIHEVFYSFLTRAEMAEWQERLRRPAEGRMASSLRRARAAARAAARVWKGK
jgi:hypothetical protein